MPKKISGGLAFVIFIAIAILVWLKGEPPAPAPAPASPAPASPAAPTSPVATPAPTPAPAATTPTITAPGATAPSIVVATPQARNSLRTLATASLLNGDKEASLLLICKDEALPWLVRAYGRGDEKVRQRVLWCVRRMEGPRRLYFKKILENQDDYNARTVEVVKEIIDNLEPKPVVVEVPVEVKKPNFAEKSEPERILVKRRKRNVSGRIGYEKVWTKTEDLRKTDIVL